MSYVKAYAWLFGVVFTVIGIWGFTLTGVEDFFGTSGETLLWFEVNPAHNVVHLLLGVVYLMGARASEAGARAVVLTLSIVYLLVGVLGFFLMDTDADILAINQADNILHVATGALGLVVVWAGRGYSTATA